MKSTRVHLSKQIECEELPCEESLFMREFRRFVRMCPWCVNKSCLNVGIKCGDDALS